MDQPFLKIFDSQESVSFPKFISRSIREMGIYRFAWINFVVNSLRMRYRRSALGFLWSLLNPLLVMTVISIVFAVIFKQDLRLFSIYIFSGLAPWWYMSAAILGGCQTLITAEGFLKKVYLPKMLFPLVSVTTETANFIFSLISLYILALILGTRIQATILYLPLAILLTFLFNLGWAMIFSVATVYFRDLNQIMQVVFQALFYMAPIVYPLEMIPEQFRSYFFFNPFYYFILLFRKSIYGEPPMTLSDWLIPTLLALATLTIGLYMLMKRDRDIIYRL